jgi:hypothetical protein
MKSKLQLVGLLCLFGLFANILAASATVGVSVGDTYKYNMEGESVTGTEEYSFSVDIKIKITKITDPLVVMDITMVTVSFDMIFTNFDIEGEVPEGEDVPEEETIQNAAIIYDSDTMTNTSMLAGVYFIDADYTPKTSSYIANVMDINMSTSVEYDNNGVLLSSNISMSMEFEGIITELTTSTTRASSSSGIPGYPMVILGLTFLISIALLRKRINV